MPDHDSELHMPGIDDAIKRLESNLISQFEKHRMLQQCVKKKHQAVRLAQIDQATLICAEENDIVQSLGELEKARLTLTFSNSPSLIDICRERLHPLRKGLRG